MSYDPSNTGTFTQVNMLALQPMVLLLNEHNYHFIFHYIGNEIQTIDYYGKSCCYRRMCYSLITHLLKTKYVSIRE